MVLEPVVCSLRGMLSVCCCRCSDEEVRWYGALEAGCKRADVEVQRYGAPELWRCAAGVWRWRCRGTDLGRSGVVLQTCRRAGMDLGSSGVVLQTCRRGDSGGVELWISSVLLSLEFLAFVPQGSLGTCGLLHLCN